MREAVTVLPKEGELMPCPFCGSEASFEHDDTGQLATWRVYCRDSVVGTKPCPMALVSTMGSARRVEAAAAWNRRVDLKRDPTPRQHTDLPARLRSLSFHWAEQGFHGDAEVYELAAGEIERLWQIT